MGNLLSHLAALLALAVTVGVSPAQAQVSGTVVDDATGLPILDARVTLRATEVRAGTDGAGAYALAVPDGAAMVVAGAHGYFSSGAYVTAPTSGVEIRLEAVHADDPAGAMLEPTDCSSCHSVQFAEWSASPMGNAGTNSWVLDIFDGTGTTGGAGGFVYTRDSPEAAANPTSECAACHQPLRWLDSNPVALGPLDDPSTDVTHGVSCAVCHQLADIDLTRPNTPGVDEGVVSYTRSTNPSEVVMYGALGDVNFETYGVMRASYNPLLRDGICAACHQDANDPDGDHDYEEEGSIISEPTYLEWLNSPYSDTDSPSYTTCVDCHMEGTDRARACNVGLDYSRPPGQVRSHRIEGTTAAFLEDAVTLTMNTAHVGEVVDVDVTIHNDRTGHHVPTGVTVRNMILLVTATRDGADLEHTGTQLLGELAGVGDPVEGYYAGLPGKIYAKRNEGADGTCPVFFTDARAITWDTRIPAMAADSTNYTFAVPAGPGDIEVHARLIYRRAWRSLVDGKGWTEDGHGRPLEDVAAPHYGHLMEEARVTLPGPPPPDAGVVDSGSPDSGAPGDAGLPPVEVTDGCQCRSAGSSSGDGGVGGSGGLFALVLILGVLGRRRRSARRRSQVTG